MFGVVFARPTERKFHKKVFEYLKEGEILSSNVVTLLHAAKRISFKKLYEIDPQ